MIEALGGFPDKTPLNPQIVGKEQRDGYRVEKLIYESRPHHHVTSTLYVPDGKGPFPGCLMPIGHSVNGKAADYIQRGSILLAKNGIAVLTYDPIGQGERRQLLGVMNKAAIPSSTSEHTLIGVGALLVGQNTATYRIWDGIRGLDYLASRPEIDAKRLGCTGCPARRHNHVVPKGPGRAHRLCRPVVLQPIAGAALRDHRPTRRRAEHHRPGRARHRTRRLSDHARSAPNAARHGHARLLRHPGELDDLPRGGANLRHSGAQRTGQPRRVQHQARLPQTPRRSGDADAAGCSTRTTR